MKRYIFITEGLNKLDILLKSINEETVYKISNSVSLENLEELQDCSNIGFIYHNNSNVFPFYDIDQIKDESDNYFQNISSDFWTKIKELKLVVDLITCNLNQAYQITSINNISEEYGIHFRYSIDQTGNSNVGGNWILENSTDITEKNTDIKNLYFNDEINKWDVILSFTPTVVSYSVSASNDITLTLNSGIPNSTSFYNLVMVKISSYIMTYSGSFKNTFNLTISNTSLSYGKIYPLEVYLYSDGLVYTTSEQNIWTFINSSLSFDSFYTNGRDCIKYKVSLTNNSGVSSVKVSSCGLCYSSTNKIPTISDSKLISDVKSFTGTIPIDISGEIVFGNMYYVRFFYKVDKYNDNDLVNTGTYYSPVHIIPTCLKPNVNSDLVVAVSMNTTELIEYGVCWSTTTGPTISNSFHVMGTNVSGSLNSTFQLTTLLPYMTYYIKTYIKHGKIIYYSLDETSFTTKPLIQTTNPIFESNSSAITGSYFLVQQNAIIETGVCWSIYPNPTILFSKTSIQDIRITKINSPQKNTLKMNLLSDETYYVRAYVMINSIVYYGDERKYTHITLSLKIELLPDLPNQSQVNTKSSCILNVRYEPISVNSCGICYSTSNKIPTIENTNENNRIFYNNKSSFVFTDKTPIEISNMFYRNQSYYVRFFYTINDNTFYSNVFVLPVVRAPRINNIYSKSININTSNLNIGDEVGICWSKNIQTVTSDFYTKIYSNTNSFSLKSLTPFTTYYLKSYIKINSTFFYSYDMLTFKTLTDTTNNVVFATPTTLFNNKPYTGDYKLNLLGSNFSNLNLSEYYMGGVNFENANFDNITTKNILGQPKLSNEYKNNYGFIVGKNLNMINPVITQDMKDIFYNVDLTNSKIIDATIVSDCLVASTVYDNTTFTSVNDPPIYKNIKDGVSFSGNELVYYNIIYPIDDDDIVKPIGPNSPKYVLTKYGIRITYVLTKTIFLIKWDGTDLSDIDISDCPLELFENTSFTNIISNSNTKLPSGLAIINKYIIGPKMILINVDFNNVFADLNIDLTGIISGGILNYDNISFSNNYTIIKNEISKFESIKIRRGGIIVGPNTNFKNIVFKESDLSPLKLINVLFDSCNFIGCFGKVNTAVNVRFVNCNYEIIGGYIVGPNVSLENANFQNNSHFISVSLRNVSSKNIQNYANVGFKNNIYQIINGCIFGKEVNVKDVEFNGQTVNVDLTDIISSNIRGTLKFNNNRYFLLEGFIVGPKVHYETIKITNDHSKNVLLNLFSENTTGVAVGTGSHTIAYSYDGITWTGLGKTIFSTRGYGIAYNGSLWVAVGEGTNSIAYSSNGFTWDTLGVGFMSVGKSVVWNGVEWFILGDDSFGATSTDGITWNKFSIDLLVKGRAVIWSGTSWIIVGDIHPTIGTTGTSGIIYSTDGSNWNAKETGFSSSCYGVAWDGTKTVVVGQYTGGNGGGSILYSNDDINWVATGENIFSTRVNGVASNGTGGWVAVGEGTNTIAYSTSNNDGSMTWTAINNTLFSVGKSVSWNKKYWVAVGEGRNSIAYSTDGIKWTGAGTDIFSSGENLAWDGILTTSSISNYSDSDQENIINIIHTYDPNAKLPIQLDIDNSNDIIITPETFQGSTSTTRYYPNFNVNNKLTLYLNDNEYIKITKLWKTTKYQTINVFYKYTKSEKILGKFVETSSAIYNKGQTLKIKKYKIVLQ